MVTRDRSGLTRDEALDGVEILRVVDWRRSYAPHTHAALMIGLPETGVLGFRRERATYRSPARTIALVNPGDLHTGFPGSKAELTYRAIYIPATFLRAKAFAIPPADSNLPMFEDGVATNDPATFDRLAAAYAAIRDAAPRLTREARLAEALALLYSRHASAARRKRDLPRASSAVRKCKAILDENLAGRVPVDRLAAEVGLSPFHLMREFRRQVGLPIHAYLTQRRVERAKELLLASTPPAAVAQELGFADQAHFTKRFKQFTGVTPGRLRRVPRAGSRRFGFVHTP